MFLSGSSQVDRCIFVSLSAYTRSSLGPFAMSNDSLIPCRL